MLITIIVTDSFDDFETRDASTSVTIIATVSFVLTTRSFEFSYLLFYKA